MIRFNPFSILLLSVAALGAVLFLNQHANGSSPGTGVIQGRTTDPLSGSPISGVRVEMTLIDADATEAFSSSAVNVLPSLPGSVRFSVISDSNGEFRFAGLRPGQYLLAGEKPGWAYTPYLGQHSSDLPAIMNLASGETATVELRMIAGGRIAGTVRTSSGEAVAGGQIQAVKRVWAKGEQYVVVVEAVALQSSGIFDLAGLAPGEYLVRYVPPKHGELSSRGTGTGSALAIAYHGGTSLAEARPVTVGTGNAVAGLTLIAAAVVPAALEGSVRVGNALPKAAGLTLVPAGEEPTALVFGNTFLGSDGSFRLGNISPGAYDLFVLATTDRGTSSARVPFAVQPAGRPSQNLTLSPTVALRGRVRAAHGNVGGVRIQAISADRLVGPTYGAIVQPNGTFEIENCSTGNYYIHAISDEGLYLKTLHYGGQQAAGMRIAVTPVVQNLDVSLEPGAQITGRLIRSTASSDWQNSSRSPYFLAVPASSQGGMLDVRAGYFDREGKFNISGARPGSYRVVAIPTLNTQVLANPAALAEIASGGISIAVSAGQTLSVDVPLVEGRK